LEDTFSFFPRKRILRQIFASLILIAYSLIASGGSPRESGGIRPDALGGNLQGRNACKSLALTGARVHDDCIASGILAN
jgi:hypothetical protein